MSCRMKQTKNKVQERSAYDIKMLEMYNPLRENYVVPGVGTEINERTAVDINLQKQWCAKCNERCDFKETYIGPRTTFDIDMQERWNTCKNKGCVYNA
jgi:hypothetical protein